VQDPQAIRAEELDKRANARLVVASNARGKTRVRRCEDLTELLDMLGLLTPEQTQDAIDHALNRQLARPLSLTNDPSFQYRPFLPESAAAS
jgi:hypothetical protein